MILRILLNQINQCLHHLLKHYLECQFEVEQETMNDELKKNVKEKNVVIDRKKKDDVVVNKIDVMKNEEPKNGELKNDELKSVELKNVEPKNDELKNDVPKREDIKNDENSKNKNIEPLSAAPRVLAVRLIMKIRRIVIAVEEE